MSSTIPPGPRAFVPAVRRPPADLSVRAVPAGPAPELPLLPNVLLPGTSHAGAAMLTADLGRHPECLSAGPLPGRFHPLRYGRAVEVHPHDYDRHFTTWAGQRYRMETSPDYFDGGRPMAEALAENLPGLSVIILLRDPAHRMWTCYADKLARCKLPAAITFDTFVDRCLALRANGADRFEGNRHFRTLSSGFYVDYLPDWLDVFGSRLRVVFTEDLQEEPGRGVRTLFEWLDLDPAQAASPAGDDDRAGYPSPEPAGPGGRRFWPVLQRRSGSWRQPQQAGAPVRQPRQTDRARSRIRSLYAGANQELAVVLRQHGVAPLPSWLSESED